MAAEYIRGVEIKLSIDTNKNTYTKQITLKSVESIEEFVERVKKQIISSVEAAKA